jgi:alpha-glucosidase (family GH31 glycosyl hydrolase)
VAHAARYFPWSDTRSGWRNQAAPMLFRQWDKSSAWGFDNGLASCITQALTLNLLGYSFSFPDMVGGNLYGSQIVTAELMIRWAQAVAPMPLIQFSLAPWDYGEECARLCARYSRLHEELAARNIALARQRAPIVRPVWWIAPQDEAALTCDDAYLIGDDLLVAPVITEGARQRDIYLPPGQWRSYWHHGEVHQGGAWLHAYPAPLDTLPLFERVARV